MDDDAAFQQYGVMVVAANGTVPRVYINARSEAVQALNAK